ncbi:hypothetical protein [Paenibacillus taichungensis]|jgi:hypothetical protein
MINQLIYFNPNSDSGHKFVLKVHANQLLDRGKVHYLDFSSDPDRFEGLLPGCNYYGDEQAFESFLLHISIDLKKRLTLFERGESLDSYPYITVIAVEMQSDENKTSFSNMFKPYMIFIRAIKYCVIVRGIELKADGSA